MKGTNVKTILISCSIVLAIILAMSSCEQESIITQLNENNPLNITHHSINGDVLKFETLEDFEAFYNQLNTLYDEDYQTFNRIVEAIDLNTVHNKMANDVFTNPADRYQPFLLDPVMMAISNEHLEFQIDDMLITTISTDAFLVSKIDDTETKAHIRLMKKDKSLNVDEIPDRAYPVFDDKMQNLIAPFVPNSTYSKRDALHKLNVKQVEKDPCTQDEGASSWGWKQGTEYAVNDVALSYLTKNYNKWGRTYEEAKVNAYSKNNGSWSNQEAHELKVTVTAQRRDKDCYEDGDEGEFKICTDCKDYRARVNVWGKKYHHGGDVYGGFVRYSGYNDGLIITASKRVYY